MGERKREGKEGRERERERKGEEESKRSYLATAAIATIIFLNEGAPSQSSCFDSKQGLWSKAFTY